MKIVITGANGQLGSELRLLEASSGFEFVYTDIDTLNLTDFDALRNFIENTKPQYLINCAAYTAVDKAETETVDANLINALVPEMLAKLSNQLNYKLIHISTDYVFSGEAWRPIREEDETFPKSKYGQTKLLGERKIAENTEAVIIRTSWLYSIFGNNFVKTMLRLGNEKEQLGIVFDQTGSPTNAADLAKVIIRIIQLSEEKNWAPGIYHYSNEGVTSWYDFALEIMELGGRNCKLNPILTHEYPLPASRPAYSVMDKKKIKSTFGISIPHWKESLKPAIEKLK